ncbi:MAG: Na+/H+ antiporter NhaC [Flavobacteriales bacterium]|nr:Na+/H+ antiporter NhaC [Flavobacteriales bacterium]
MDQYRKPTLLQSFIPIIVLVALLVVNVRFVYGDSSLDGANQITLLVSAAVAGIIALYNGYRWNDIMHGIEKSIKSALSALIILLLIGSLAGTWLISGVVPAMIYYGLDILSPTIFLFATCVISSIVSVATGSSWSTVATVGIALLGIGKALGISDGLIAGAIISGAYFGDKMSPLSDTTNLAPAMAGTDLITHIKYMAYTTIPSIVITLIIFLVIGFFYDGSGQVTEIDTLKSAIASKFNITPWLFVVPLLVIVLIVKKMPAIPALLIGSILGGVFAIIFQPDLINSLSGETNFMLGSYKTVVDAMTTDVAIVTENELVNDLLTSGGMSGMLNTIWLIVCAMTFGGVMEQCGMLKRITQSIINLAKSTGSLIATTASSCVVFNLTASDQYLAIVVPGRMFAEEYRERDLHPKVLSRTLEDSGTVTSALIPWNTCGAYHSGVLGIATGDYWMYCFFNLISPLMTMVFGYLGIKIARLEHNENKEEL